MQQFNNPRCIAIGVAITELLSTDSWAHQWIGVIIWSTTSQLVINNGSLNPSLTQPENFTLTLRSMDMNRGCWVHYMIRSDKNCATTWQMHLIWHELYDQCIWSDMKCMWWMQLTSHKVMNAMQLISNEVYMVNATDAIWTLSNAATLRRLSLSIRIYPSISSSWKHLLHHEPWRIFVRVKHLGPNKLWRIILMPPKLWCGRQFVKSVRGWIASPWLWPDTHLTKTRMGPVWTHPHPPSSSRPLLLLTHIFQKEPFHRCCILGCWVLMRLVLR